MAPTLYEWQGIRFTFFANDHEPVHIHCIYNEFESICEFLLSNGKVIDLKWRSVEGSHQLPSTQKKMALRLVKKYKYEIIDKWMDFFILKKQVKLKRIHSKEL